MLVSTTLVSALYFSARLVTACPQLWNATRAMGTRTFHERSSAGVPAALGARVRMRAAAMQRSIWSVKEATSTQRRRAEKRRWKRLKRKAPRQKDASETRDF